MCILKGNRAIAAYNNYIENTNYKRNHWLTFSGYFSHMDNQKNDWNKYAVAKVEDNKLNYFYAFSFYRYDRYADLMLIITKENKDNFFKIIDQIKKDVEQFQFIDYIRFNIAKENKAIFNIIKKMIGRYNNLYFLGESLNNEAVSALGNKSSYLTFVYFIRDKENYLNNFILEIQKYFKI